MQSTADPQELTKIRRRRGATCSSITRLEKRLGELESISDQPTTADHTQELTVKLKTLDVDFKAYHLQLVDLLEEGEDEVLEREQEILDEHDDLVADMNILLKRLGSIATPSPVDHQKLSLRKLTHLEKGIITTRDAITALSIDHDDVSLIEQYEAQLSDYKTELSTIHTKLLSVDDEGVVQDQLTIHSKLEVVLFECFHYIRKLLKTCKTYESTTTMTTTRLIALDWVCGFLNWQFQLLTVIFSTGDNSGNRSVCLFTIAQIYLMPRNLYIYSMPSRMVLPSL